MEPHDAGRDVDFSGEAELPSRLFSFDQSSDLSPTSLRSSNMSSVKKAETKMLSRARYVGLLSEGPLHSYLIYSQHSTG